jgi:DNA-binding MurR/RpiR family transcriptional regulator
MGSSKPSVAPREPSASFEAWVAGLERAESLTHKGRAVLKVLRTQPRLSAFASARALAAEAGVNVGTVTRASQAIGFAGWTELQQEFRSRYVAGLSAVEVAEEHSLDEVTASSSIARDRNSLQQLERSVSREAIAEAAKRIREARRTVVLAQGSYASLGVALAHNASLSGYDVVHLADPAILANMLARLRPGDLLVAINCWQIYTSTVEALRSAVEKDVATILLSDSGAPPFGSTATLQIAVPSEGVGFFPSLVPALSVVQAIVVEVAAADPAATRRALTGAEQEWQRFSLLSYPAR